MVDDTKIENYVKEPKWYLELRSKIRLRSERQFVGFFAPLLLSPAISAVVMLALFLVVTINEPYASIITVTIIIFMFIFLYLLVRKYYVLKDTKYDRFDLFAYNCGNIGLDLERLLLIPNFNHYLIQNINALRVNSWFIRRKNYKTEDDKKLRKSLASLPLLSFKLLDIVDNVNTNRKDIEKLSKMYLSIGHHISEDIKPRIHPNMIFETVSLLEKIKKVKISQQIKSLLKSKATIFITITLICSIILAIISYQLTSDIGIAILSFIGTLAAIPTLYLAIKGLSNQS